MAASVAAGLLPLDDYLCVMMSCMTIIYASSSRDHSLILILGELDDDGGRPCPCAEWPTARADSGRAGGGLRGTPVRA